MSYSLKSHIQSFYYFSVVHFKLSIAIMKQTFYCLLVICSTLFINSCAQKSQDKSETVQNNAPVQVVLYGSYSCGHCTEFRAKLDSLNISYTFNDVEQNKALADEMFEVVHSVNYYDYIEFPVVAVGKQVFINPPLDQVLNAL